MFKRKHANKDKIKFQIPIVRYLVYLLVVTLAVSGVSLSRYSVSSGTIESARVAKLAGTFTHDDTWTIDEYNDFSVLPVGQHKDYVFTIKNDSEVAMRVRIMDVSTSAVLQSNYYSVFDGSGQSGVTVTNGWFDFSPAGLPDDTRTVTISLDSTTTGNNLTIFFEYQQID